MKFFLCTLFFLIQATLSSAVIECEDVSLFDEPLKIRILESPPGKKVTIGARLLDRRGEEWSSHAVFRADESGVVDLTRDAPIKGSYEGVDGMGLFWSMKGEIKQPHFPSLNGRDLAVELYVKGDVSRKITRVLCADGVQRIEVRENGIVATLFLPEHEQRVPLIISLTGANGGVSEKRASLLASHGFATLAVGYFRDVGLPPTLQEIPIEYFEKIFAWADKQPEFNGRMALYGSSRGGELSLLLASLYPDRFEGVVATVPSSVTWGGFKDPTGPAWTLGGKEILPVAPPPSIRILKGGHRPSKPIKFTPFLMETQDSWDVAAIPVEKIRARLFLISAGDDQMWPSSEFCRRIMNRLEEKKSIAVRTHTNFPESGHAISIPYIPTTCVYMHPTLRRWTSNGGTAQNDNEASRASWKGVIAFFEDLGFQAN